MNIPDPPITDPELATLRKLGFVYSGPSGNPCVAPSVLRAYRAGFRDGVESAGGAR